MRDILFRGKQIDNGEWVYGDLGQNQIDNNAVNWIENYNPETRIRRSIMVIHETVGQFTGLTDKNGVKIFEGDIDKNGGIVEFFNSLNWDSGGSVHSGFYCKKWFESDQELSYHYGFDDFEIIGNIHDNSELL